MQKNKRVFITGGASGLGRELALRFAKDGYQVCIGDIHLSRGEETLNELKNNGTNAHLIFCDVTKEADLVSALDWLEKNWNGVDVLINNAGVAVCGSVSDTTLENWQWIIDINLLGVVRGCKVFSTYFKRQGSGHIVNIASMAGLVHPPLMAAYNATKAGVVALSETLAFELQELGISVSVACPSFFKTNLSETMRSTDQESFKMGERLITQARKNSDEVANTIFCGIKNKDFLIMTHAECHVAWGLKRLLSSRIYQKIFLKALKRDYFF